MALLCGSATTSYAEGLGAGSRSVRVSGMGHCRTLLAALLLLLIGAAGGAQAQAVDWTAVFREIGQQAEAPPQSRIDPEALRALESRTLGQSGSAAGARSTGQPASQTAVDVTAPPLPRQTAPVAPAEARPAETRPAEPPPAPRSAADLARQGRGVLATPLLTETLQSGEPAAPPSRLPGVERPPDLEAYGRLAERYNDTMIGRTTEQVETFRARMRRLVDTLPTLPATFGDTLRAAAPTGSLDYYPPVFAVILLMLAAGRVTIAVLGPLLGRPVMVAVQRHSPPEGMRGKLPVLATRIVVTTVLVLLSFIPVTFVALFMLDKSRTAEVTAGIVIGAYALYIVVDAMWRMVISPYLPAYRIPKIDDEGARRLYLWISAGAFATMLSEATLVWLGEIAAGESVVAVASIVLRLVAVAVIIAMIWVNRRAIRSAILGGRAPVEANWIAAAAALLMPPLVTAYFVAAWFEGSVRLILGLKQGLPLFLGPFVTLMVSLLVYAVATFVIETIFARARLRAAINAEMQARAAAEAEARAEAVMPGPALAERPAAEIVPLRPQGGGDDGDEDGAPLPMPRPVAGRARPVPMPDRSRMRSFEDLGYRFASLLAASVGAYMMTRIWVGPGAFAEGGPLDWLDDIIDKLFVGYFGYHAVRIWLDQRIEEEGGDAVMTEPGDEGGGASASSRLATLLPLFRSFILIVIGMSVVVLVASDFGFNLAPLFAGAGVVGLALGFGAQTLVRDILSGVFYLIDDAFRKGEYIDVGDVKGTVEKISLRSFQLRHHLGALNTIPFGEIKHLTNYSRDWVITKLPLRLTYDTDVDKVRKVIKKLGEELLKHPTEGHKFVQPLKSQGVYMMEDSAMILRSPAHAPLRPRPSELRPVRIETGVSRHAEGSCLIRFGDTHVLCTATVEDKAPPFLRNTGLGWVTAEYAMLPRATTDPQPPRAAGRRPAARRKSSA
jgi:moderate conductance mechanosensitive channel